MAIRITMSTGIMKIMNMATTSRTTTMTTMTTMTMSTNMNTTSTTITGITNMNTATTTGTSSDLTRGDRTGTVVSQVFVVESISVFFGLDFLVGQPSSDSKEVEIAIPSVGYISPLQRYLVIACSNQSSQSYYNGAGARRNTSQVEYAARWDITSRRFNSDKTLVAIG